MISKKFFVRHQSYLNAMKSRKWALNHIEKMGVKPRMSDIDSTLRDAGGDYYQYYGDKIVPISYFKNYLKNTLISDIETNIEVPWL